MFDALLAKFPRDPSPSALSLSMSSPPGIDGLRELFDELGGASLARGLYRVVVPADEIVWRERIRAVFPDHADYVFPFGFDWLGRVFAADWRRKVLGEPGVVMLEPGTGHVLEIPTNLKTFHTQELVHYAEAALAANFHSSWLASGGTAPAYDRCVSYKVPLFLGGSDQTDNLEDSDLDMYWHITGQLLAGMRSGT